MGVPGKDTQGVLEYWDREQKITGFFCFFCITPSLLKPPEMAGPTNRSQGGRSKPRPPGVDSSLRSRIGYLSPVEVLEGREFFQEAQFHCPRGAVALFADDDLCHALNGGIFPVDFLPVNK